MAIALSGCNFLTKKESSAPTKEVVAIATVNGEILPFDYYKQLYLAQRIDLTGAEGPIATARQTQKEAILNDQIDQILLLQAAKKHQLTVKDDELEGVFKSVTANWDAAELEKELAQRGQTIDSFKGQLAKNLLISRYLSQEVYARVDVTDEELLAKYQENPQLYVQEEAVNVRQILVPSEELAGEVAEELKKGAKFPDVAVQYSVASESHMGGSMGWIKRGNLPEDLEAVIFSLKPGKISDIIKSEYGFHLFLVEEHLPAKELKFDQVKAAISRNVRADKEQAAQATVLEELRSAAKIEINQDLFDRLD